MGNSREPRGHDQIQVRRQATRMSSETNSTLPFPAGAADPRRSNAVGEMSDANRCPTRSASRVVKWPSAQGHLLRPHAGAAPGGAATGSARISSARIRCRNPTGFPGRICSPSSPGFSNPGFVGVRKWECHRFQYRPVETARALHSRRHRAFSGLSRVSPLGVNHELMRPIAIDPHVGVRFMADRKSERTSISTRSAN